MLTIDVFALENSQQIVNIDCTYVNLIFFFRRSNKACVIGIHVEGYISITVIGKRTRTNRRRTIRKRSNILHILAYGF